MNNAASINDRLETMNMDPEARARALQAAFIGEIVSSALAGIGRTVSRLVNDWREWSELRRSLDYLERLDERLLADIGLSHATLEETLRRSARTTAVPPVEAVIADTATVATAANQDRGQDRAARRNAA
jgi:uncharacterized protein YjiS (DUF1127 family)